LESEGAWGSAAAKALIQPEGCSQPQNVALPAWGLKRSLVNSTAIALPPLLKLNAGATVW
jgi:hypothetical protein